MTVTVGFNNQLNFIDSKSVIWNLVQKRNDCVVDISATAIFNPCQTLLTGMDLSIPCTPVTQKDTICSAIAKLQCQISSGGVLSVTDDGSGVVVVDNTDPQNPIVGFGGVFVDGITITGDGSSGNPLVSAAGAPFITSIADTNTIDLNVGANVLTANLRYVDSAEFDLSDSVAGFTGVLKTTGVAAGTYGDASNVAQFTVDTKGRLTFAQNVPIGISSLAWLLNGNTVGSEKWIGTIDNFDYPIRTNNTERARVFKTGEVGIGIIAAPQARFHVRGTTSDNTAIAIQIESSAASTFLVMRNDGSYSIGLNASASLVNQNALDININGVIGANDASNSRIAIGGTTDHANAMSVGFGSNANNNGAIAVGSYASSTGQEAGSFGFQIASTASGSYILGGDFYGTITNNIPRSFMLGLGGSSSDTLSVLHQQSFFVNFKTNVVLNGLVALTTGTSYDTYTSNTLTVHDGSQGTVEAITGVTSSGGKAQLTYNYANQSLINGDIVILSGFAGFPAYNGTWYLNITDARIYPTRADAIAQTNAQAFLGNDTGTMTPQVRNPTMNIANSFQLYSISGQPWVREASGTTFQIQPLSGGTIPAGTTGQTLYYAANGTVVTPTSNLYNDGTNVGIGGTPTELFQVFRGSNSAIQVRSATDDIDIGDVTGALVGMSLNVSNANQTIQIGDGNFAGISTITLSHSLATINYLAAAGHFFDGDVAIQGDASVTGKLTVTGAIDPTHLYLNEQAGDPTNVANEGIIYTKDVAGVTQLFYMADDATVYQISNVGGGTVTSVSGTLNRVSSTGGATPVIDIDAAYVGQSSITTLGTIGSGTWQGSVINSTYGGMGVNNAGRTLTIAANSGTISFTSSVTLTVAATASVSGTNTGDQTIAGLSPLTTKGDIFTFSTVNTRLGVATGDGKILQVSSGAATGLAWSTPTYPSASGTAGKVLRSDGTNNVYSTYTIPDTYSTGDIIQASASNVFSALASVATGNVLISGGVTTVSSWGKVGLTTHVSGILPLANGGSNKNMTAVNGGVVWTDTDSMEVSAAGTTGQFLKSNGAAAPTWADMPIGVLACSMGSGNTMALSSTQYAMFFFGNSTGTNESVRNFTIQQACTIKFLTVRTSNAQSGTGAMVVTVRKGGAGTTLTLTISAGALAGTFTDLTHSFTVVQGDVVCLEFANAATVVSANVLEVSCWMFYA